MTKTNTTLPKKGKVEIDRDILLSIINLATKEINSTKQNGVIFYIPAWCTSKIDPTTGFVNLLFVL